METTEQPPADLLTESPTQARSVRRFTHTPSLDGVRGLAVLLVVLSHFSGKLIPVSGGRVEWAAILDGGWLGVDIFFVLSGFLITALLLGESNDNGRIRFGAFYARRALRLLPPLYLVFAAFYGFALLTHDSLERARHGILAGVLYANNWYPVFHPVSSPPNLGHLWSLAIEEQFYLIWPSLVVLALGRARKVDRVAWLALALIVVVAIYRPFVWPDNPLIGLVRTDTRADSLLVGALLAALYVGGRTPRRFLAPAAWIGLATMAACEWHATTRSAFFRCGGFTLFAVAVALVVLGCVDSTWAGTRFFELRPMRLLGRVSYGIYLWHLPVFYAVLYYGVGWSSWVRITVAMVATGVLVTISWNTVERWARVLRKRFEVRHLAELAPGPPSDTDGFAAGPGCPPRPRVYRAAAALVVGVAVVASGVGVARALPQFDFIGFNRRKLEAPLVKVETALTRAGAVCAPLPVPAPLVVTPYSRLYTPVGIRACRFGDAQFSLRLFKSREALEVYRGRYVSIGCAMLRRIGRTSINSVSSGSWIIGGGGDAVIAKVAAATHIEPVTTPCP